MQKTAVWQCQPESNKGEYGARSHMFCRVIIFFFSFVLFMCVCIFILICFTSNKIFVFNLLLLACLFCFNKLPQNEFNHITCSISSAIISPETDPIYGQEVDKFHIVCENISLILCVHTDILRRFFFLHQFVIVHVHWLCPISVATVAIRRKYNEKKQEKNVEIYQLKNVCNWKYICNCYVY